VCHHLPENNSGKIIPELIVVTTDGKKIPKNNSPAEIPAYFYFLEFPRYFAGFCQVRRCPRKNGLPQPRGSIELGDGGDALASRQSLLGAITPSISPLSHKI
jgi:hypothetical protein